MKTSALAPISRTLMRLFGKQAPVPVPVTTDSYMRPVEMRRYIRHLRETRRCYLDNDLFN